MTLKELSRILSADLIITYPDFVGNFMCELKDVDVILEPGCLGGACGHGERIIDAMQDYVNQIRCKKCVVSAYSETNRHEFYVPASLTNEE